MIPRFVRNNVRKSPGYTPGEQPAIGQRVIKLNTNENPFPPSPKVMHAVHSFDAEALRRYPNPTADPFRRAVSTVTSLPLEMIIGGNGSDDVLSIAMRTFFGPGDLVAFPDPTYSLYSVLADLDEVRWSTVPWERNWDLPIEGLLASKPRGIFLANPNAPTGTFVSPSRIKQLLELFSGLVLIDEAYVDFAGENCMPLLREHQNLIISRTLSKAYSLAGLRFGYAMAHAEVIAEMMKVKDSYNCDAIAIAAATAAMLDQEYAGRTWQYVCAERERVTGELTAMGFAVLPSRANFVLATVPGGKGRAAYDELKGKGILVRYFDKPGLQDKIRISIGKREENDALLAVLKTLAAAERAA